jgi:hypothetical protein
MALLQSTNVQGTLCVNGVAIGGGKDFYFCCISGSGTYTPSSGLVGADGILDITLVGGGGSGTKCQCDCGNCGGGGGGGAIFQGIRKMTDSGAACTLTVGAGGAAQTVANTNGNNGGDTIFDSCTLPGAIAFGGGGGGTCRGTAGGMTSAAYRGAGDSNSAGGGGAFTPATTGGGTQGGTYAGRRSPMLYANPSASLQSNPAAAVGFGVGMMGNECQGACSLNYAGRGLKDMGNGGKGAGGGISGGSAGYHIGQDAGGFGNGGAGSSSGDSGAGSDGIIILKWAE